MGKFDQVIKVPASALELTPAEEEREQRHLQEFRSMLGAMDAYVEKVWKDAGGDGPAPRARLFVRLGGLFGGGE